MPLLLTTFIFWWVGFSGVMDSMMEVLESYANHLEEKVAERTRELDAANANLQNLLHQVSLLDLEPLDDIGLNLLLPFNTLVIRCTILQYKQ
jgi:nitrate/nitrite-specific signal transduction histidine kinase